MPILLFIQSPSLYTWAPSCCYHNTYSCYGGALFEQKIRVKKNGSCDRPPTVDRDSRNTGNQFQLPISRTTKTHPHLVPPPIESPKMLAASWKAAGFSYVYLQSGHHPLPSPRAPFVWSLTPMGINPTGTTNTYRLRPA